MQPFLNKDYNVKGDNFFTSLPLARELEMNRTTLVGSWRSNRKEISTRLLLQEERTVERDSLQFLLTEDMQNMQLQNIKICFLHQHCAQFMQCR
jgi:hypothetical protein